MLPSAKVFDGGGSQGSLLEDMTPKLNPEGHVGVRGEGWARI